MSKKEIVWSVKRDFRDHFVNVKTPPNLLTINPSRQCGTPRCATLS